MFKRISLFLIAVMAVFAISSGANAAPVYYTFTGTTTSSSDAAGAVAAAGLSTVGSAVSYTFLVDTAGAGYYTRYNGTIYTYTDTVTYDLFYTDLLSAAPILNQNGGYAPYMTGSFTKKHNYGLSENGNGYTRFYAGSSSNNTYIINSPSYSGGFYLAMADWVIGSTGFRGYTSAYNSDATYSYLYSSLTLTGISSTNPLSSSVPEPSTLLLLGSGLAGLGFVRRKFAV